MFINKIYVVLITLAVIIILNIILYNNNIYKSSVRCYGSIYNRTCLYTNVYYQNGKWFVINLSKNKLKCVAIRSRSSNLCFKPSIYKFDIKYNKIINGITTYIRLFYSGNIAHLLWDDLYSLYLSFLKFNYNMNPFNIIISKTDSKWRNNWQSNIFEKFSMKKLIYENDIKNKKILIKKLLVGLAHQCQRCVNKDYSIAGGKEYKATWWMRKRMYHVYNITKCNNRNAIIVHNKRYSKEEVDILLNITNSYSRNELNIIYIDWSKIRDFKKQLDILSCTSVYISGPGTGLLNFPFISDPGIIINLGGLYRGCPSFMEQYVEEGSMHFVSLYYPSNKRIYGLKYHEIEILINRGIYLLKYWKICKKQHNNNLNVEGIIFQAIAKKNPHLMKKLLIETDFAIDGGHGIWAERLIYFPYCYNRSYIVDIVFNETTYYENELGCRSSKSKELCD